MNNEQSFNELVSIRLASSRVYIEKLEYFIFYGFIIIAALVSYIIWDHRKRISAPDDTKKTEQ